MPRGPPPTAAAPRWPSLRPRSTPGRARGRRDDRRAPVRFRERRGGRQDARRGKAARARGARRARRAVGELVCGWGFKDRVVLSRWSRPRRTGIRLALRHGHGPWATEVFGRPTRRELVRLRDRLVAAPGRVADAAGDLLARGRF